MTIQRDSNKSRGNLVFIITIHVCTTKIIWDGPNATNKLPRHRKIKHLLQHGTAPTIVGNLLRSELEISQI